MELAEQTPAPARRPDVDRYIVGRPNDVPEGGRIIVTAGNREVGVFRIDGRFHALLHRCPHLGGPLCLGPVIGLVESDGPGDLRLNEDRKFLTCPWHAWEFDIETGQSYWNPLRTRARPFPVEVKEGAELSGDELPAQRIPGPHKAEKIPIDVEVVADGEYLVVSMRRNATRSESDASL